MPRFVPVWWLHLNQKIMLLWFITYKFFVEFKISHTLVFKMAMIVTVETWQYNLYQHILQLVIKLVVVIKHRSVVVIGAWTFIRIQSIQNRYLHQAQVKTLRPKLLFQQQIQPQLQILYRMRSSWQQSKVSCQRWGYIRIDRKFGEKHRKLVSGISQG